MGKNITKVPNGPLIKKKGPFKGSTLKSGGKVIKKAQGGTTTTQTTTPVKKTWNQMTPTERKAAQDAVRKKGGREGFSTFMDSIGTSQFAEGAARKKMTVDQYRIFLKKNGKLEDAQPEGLQTKEACKRGDTKGSCAPKNEGQTFKGGSLNDVNKNGGIMKKAKAGAMIKRADGSFSKRGLWDNIRANKGSGKKPTKQMLVQEKKIKAKSKK
jgi:hypothetical protein